MRIITGQARGKRLFAPEGLETRPTTDKVKQAIFNIIQFDIEDKSVLDLFAGTGQLGLEALSRGASHCIFVENAKNAQEAVEKNIKTCNFQAKSTLARSDYSAFLQRCAGKGFGLIFLDPPYGGKLISNAISLICSANLLETDGIMVCEHGVEDALPELNAPYREVRRYEYGGKIITLITRD